MGLLDVLLVATCVYTCLTSVKSVGQSSGDLRLVTNSGQTSTDGGRLEIFLNGQWGTVCGEGFRQEEGAVACSQLGFVGVIGYAPVGNLGYGEAPFSTPTWLNNIDCNGNETRLVACPHSVAGMGVCTHADDIGLVCYGVPSSNPTDGTLRLNTGDVQFPRTYSGRLEVYWNGLWGTVCDDFFGQQEADVACRQLGFESALFYGDVSDIGFPEAPVAFPIWLDDLDCQLANDTKLLQCATRPVGINNCRHREDVALVCLGSGSLRVIGTSTTSPTSVSRRSGRLEVYVNQQWGTICTESFNQSAADIACRQLGYRRTVDYGSVRELGFLSANASTPDWLSGLQCSSQEISLLSCANDGLGRSDCSQGSSQVAVVCSSSSAGSSDNGTGYAVGISFAALFVTALFICMAAIFVYGGKDLVEFLKCDCCRNRRHRIRSTSNSHREESEEFPTYSKEPQQAPAPYSVPIQLSPTTERTEGLVPNLSQNEDRSYADIPPPDVKIVEESDLTKEGPPTYKDVVPNCT